MTELGEYYLSDEPSIDVMLSGVSYKLSPGNTEIRLYRSEQLGANEPLEGYDHVLHGVMKEGQQKYMYVLLDELEPDVLFYLLENDYSRRVSDVPPSYILGHVMNQHMPSYPDERVDPSQVDKFLDEVLGENPQGTSN